jgi:sec-independent protein translocase protein TatA
MPNIGPFELIFVLVIALLLLGPKRLPTAARALGRSIDEFRHGLTDQARDRSATPPHSDMDTEITQPSTPTAATSVARSADSPTSDGDRNQVE